MNKLENQNCPICNKKSLTLQEDSTEVPFFGKLYLFSMDCSSCKYSMSDVEAEEQKEPSKFTIEISSEEDMGIRVVKSSQATVKIPQLKISMEPRQNSIGFVSNIEGLLNKFERVIEDQRESSEEPEIKKKAKSLLKKIRRVKLGDEKLRIIIEDPSGNSAIISKKTKIEELNKNK